VPSFKPVCAGVLDAVNRLVLVLVATPILNVSLAERLPRSVAVTLTPSVPTSPAPGVPLNVRVAGVNVSHAGRALPLRFYDGVVPPSDALTWTNFKQRFVLLDQWRDAVSLKFEKSPRAVRLLWLVRDRLWRDGFCYATDLHLSARLKVRQ
jgi:hypothetical protein